MERSLLTMWSALIWRGLFSIAFGVCALIWSGDFISVLTFVLGLYLAADGIMTLIGVYYGENAEGDRLIPTSIGVACILLGLVAIFAPAVVVKYAILVIGAWNIWIGILQIMAAIVLRREIDDEWWQALYGVVSILFGILIIVNWWLAALSMAILIGVAAVVTGILLVMLGLKVRRVGRRVAEQITSG
jgi:uncharacterized membrane protein HdeD (DUF308 family)